MFVFFGVRGRGGGGGGREEKGDTEPSDRQKRVALRRLSIITSLDVGEEWVWMNVYLS